MYNFSFDEFLTMVLIMQLPNLCKTDGEGEEKS